MNRIYGGTPVEDPWLRQEGETAKAYEDFLAYRDLGLRRSLAKAADKVGKSVQHMEDLSRQNRWVSRCRDWDNHESKIINRELLAGKADMRKRMANLSAAIQSKVAKRVLTMTDADIAALTIGEAVALAKYASDLEMKVRAFEEEESNTDPFVVVVNVIEDRSPEERKVLEAAVAIPDSGIVEVVAVDDDNVIP